MNYAIILAGGIGSRFWPLSTAREPKQFLNIGSNKPLLIHSVMRINKIINKENIYIATNKNYKVRIKDYLRKSAIPFKNILFEPESKNTFAPISILSGMIFNQDKEAVIVVLPSDHFIKNKSKFLKILEKGIVCAKNGYIVTLGIKPKRAETGYGYLKINSQPQPLNSQVYKVDRFIEKPDIKTAKKFIKDKRFYWNGGIFIFKAKVLLEEIKKNVPHAYEIIADIKDKEDLYKFWHKIPYTSIDYAVMEKTKKLALLPLECGWLDVGNCQALEELMKKDRNGNIFKGRHIDLGSRNITVWGKERLVATIGLKDIIIVDAPTALLVCAKNKSQEIKQFVKKLKLNES